MGANEPGPRDHLVTRSLQRGLDGVDLESRVEQALDPAEAPERLARHAMEEIRRALEGDAPSDAKAERVNDIFRRFLDVATRRPGSRSQPDSFRASRLDRRSATSCLFRLHPLRR